MDRLKKRWGIENNLQLVIIFIVFALTGSSSVRLAEPLLDFIGIDGDRVNPWLYWPFRVLLIFPLYQLLLVAYGWLFGQFAFFWNMEKKILKRLGLGFIIPEGDSPGPGPKH